MAKTILLYGPSGSFKTSNIGQAAQWAVQRYGGVVRGLFGDNYGPLGWEVANDIVEPWSLTTTPDPLACILLAAQGYWPTNLVDGRATDKLAMTKAWDGVAGYIIEGLHENGVLIMRNLEQKQRSTGEPLVAEFGELVDGLKVQYAMASRGTYGFVQNQTHRYFKMGFAGLPVPWVFVTTHEFRGKDKSDKRLVGPMIVGKAMTGVTSQWFDHVLHFEQFNQQVTLSAEEQKTAGVKTVLRAGSRAWFTRHPDEEVPSLMWPAKLGVEPWLMEHIYGRWPKGYIPLVNNANGYVSSVRTLLELIDPVEGDE